jgi:hypothetical protein
MINTSRYSNDMARLFLMALLLVVAICSRVAAHSHVPAVINSSVPIRGAHPAQDRTALSRGATRAVLRSRQSNGRLWVVWTPVTPVAWRHGLRNGDSDVSTYCTAPGTWQHPGTHDETVFGDRPLSSARCAGLLTSAVGQCNAAAARAEWRPRSARD